MSTSQLSPWLHTQLSTLLSRRGHAWLLQGPSGLGQYNLALELARAWLCENPTPTGACYQCSSCHSVDVRTHPDLCVLMPETMALELEWPLDEKSQKEIDDKKRKPSKEIRVESAREMISFSQHTRSGGHTKVVLVYPAERMNHVTANAILKTLEEPPGECRFILASEAAHILLPTIRSRCQTHTMVWPDEKEALDWLVAQGLPSADAKATLRAAGGRPEDALQLANTGLKAAQWSGFPLMVSRGQLAALADLTPAQAIDRLQKLCHDMLALHTGATPRFFEVADLNAVIGNARGASSKSSALVAPSASSAPAASGSSDAKRQTSAAIYPLTQWAKDLMEAARTAQHPYNPGLMLEALMAQAQQALR
jgi:DNA polymerase-3 subunit delta'